MAARFVRSRGMWSFPPVRRAASGGARRFEVRASEGNGGNVVGAKKKRPYAGSSTGSFDDDLDGEWCAPSLVSVDNDSHDAFTVFEISVQDYPGLLRVLAWVLNGLELRVQNATFRTTDGYADNKVWVTTYNGRKLTDKYAQTCADRLRDFALFCVPDRTEHLRTEFGKGNIVLSNSAHPDFSLLTITGEPDRQGFLLEVASVVSGLGLSVREGSIQSCDDCGTEVSIEDYREAAGGGRMFQLFITTSDGGKLDRADASGLLFVLNMVIDPKSHGPTVAPTMV